MLLEEDGDHEDLTAPLVVIASVKKSESRLKNINRYTYVRGAYLGNINHSVNTRYSYVSGLYVEIVKYFY